MIALEFKKDSAIQKNSRISSLKIDKEVQAPSMKKKENNNQMAANLKETLQKVKFGEKAL